MNWIKKTWSETKSNPKTVREFGFILSGVLLLLPLATNILGMVFAKRPFHYWLGWPIVSALVFVVNVFLPSSMASLYRLAMFLSHGISWIVMRIILTVLFYLVFSVFGMIMRAMGKDLLDQKFDTSLATYWKKRHSRLSREQYERLF